jgi:hypothetical protein
MSQQHIEATEQQKERTTNTPTANTKVLTTLNTTPFSAAEIKEDGKSCKKSIKNSIEKKSNAVVSTDTNTVIKEVRHTDVQNKENSVLQLSTTIVS